MLAGTASGVESSSRIDAIIAESAARRLQATLPKGQASGRRESTQLQSHCQMCILPCFESSEWCSCGCCSSSKSFFKSILLSAAPMRSKINNFAHAAFASSLAASHKSDVQVRHVHSEDGPPLPVDLQLRGLLQLQVLHLASVLLRLSAKRGAVIE